MRSSAQNFSLSQVLNDIRHVVRSHCNCLSLSLLILSDLRLLPQAADAQACSAASRNSASHCPMLSAQLGPQNLFWTICRPRPAISSIETGVSGTESSIKPYQNTRSPPGIVIAQPPIYDPRLDDLSLQWSGSNEAINKFLSATVLVAIAQWIAISAYNLSFFCNSTCSALASDMHMNRCGRARSRSSRFAMRLPWGSAQIISIRTRIPHTIS